MAETLIALFFTRGISLRHWAEAGLLSRETALYRELTRHGVRTAFFTYGGNADLQFADQLPQGSLLCVNRWRLPLRLYEWTMPIFHARVLRKADVIKSNQTNGADVALAVARFWKKPFIARSGYLWSRNAILANGENSRAANHCLALEKKVFGGAEQIIVTTLSIAENIHQRFPSVTDRLRVVPNYVDTELFSPLMEERIFKRPRICFVGRLVVEKNLEALIAAISPLDVELELVGDGVLRGQLAGMAGNSLVRFTGTLAHDKLPERLRQATAFVLPSLYEGHPKALLEAMSCGLPVIATDVPGNRELIRHGETGWLCGTDADAIRIAIETVLADAALRRRLSENARRYVLENCSLQRVVELELSCLREILTVRKHLC